MENQNNKANAFQHKRQPQGTENIAQSKRIFSVLGSKPKTLRMVEVETGIKIRSISWRVFDLQKEDRIKVVFKDICPISKHRAGFYTTNPDLFPAIVEPSNTDKL